MIPQLTARPAFVEELETLGADFHEIVLMDSRDGSSCGSWRVTRPATPWWRSSSLTTARGVVAVSARAHVVECRAGRFDEAYAVLLAHLRDRLRTA